MWNGAGFSGISKAQLDGIVLAPYWVGARGNVAAMGSGVMTMKHSRSTTSPVPSADPSMDDESMAMVYVGDVYSLVVQEGVPTKPAKKEVKQEAKKEETPQGDDSLWPLIR